MLRSKLMIMTLELLIFWQRTLSYDDAAVLLCETSALISAVRGLLRSPAGSRPQSCRSWPCTPRRPVPSVTRLWRPSLRHFTGYRRHLWLQQTARLGPSPIVGDLQLRENGIPTYFSLNPRSAGISSGTRRDGEGGGKYYPPATREPADVAKWARRQSKALNDCFLR